MRHSIGDTCSVQETTRKVKVGTCRETSAHAHAHKQTPHMTHNAQRTKHHTTHMMNKMQCTTQNTQHHNHTHTCHKCHILSRCTHTCQINNIFALRRWHGNFAREAHRALRTGLGLVLQARAYARGTMVQAQQSCGNQHCKQQHSVIRFIAWPTGAAPCSGSLSFPRRGVLVTC